MTFTNKEIEKLRLEQKMMKIELDERHREMLKAAYQLGIKEGKHQAKRAIQWRLNGDLWASFIDKDEYAS